MKGILRNFAFLHFFNFHFLIHPISLSPYALAPCGISKAPAPSGTGDNPQGKRSPAEQFPVPVKLHRDFRFQTDNLGSIVADLGHFDMFPRKNRGEKPVKPEGFHRVHPADIKEAIVRFGQGRNLHPLPVTLDVPEGHHQDRPLEGFLIGSQDDLFGFVGQGLQEDRKHVSGLSRDVAAQSVGDGVDFGVETDASHAGHILFVIHPDYIDLLDPPARQEIAGKVQVVFDPEVAGDVVSGSERNDARTAFSPTSDCRLSAWFHPLRKRQ